MNLTNHAYERYCERILNIPTTQVLEYLKVEENKTQILEAMNELYEKSVYITDAAYHGNDSAKFYIVEDIVLVVNSAGQAIMTCFKVEFGFGEVTDKIITKNLLTEILVEQENVAEAVEKHTEFTLHQQNEIDSIDRQIKSLEVQIEALKSQKSGLEFCIKSNSGKLVMKQEKLKQLCYKIIYSINYNVDKITAGRK